MSESFDVQKQKIIQSSVSTYNDYIGEYRKIIWPDRQTLTKSTVSVITISLIIGAVICLLDAGFAAGFSFFASLL